MDTEDLTKVHIDLPNHWAVGGESMWARALGGNEYELHNVPFYAYDLNHLDVVEAVAQGEHLKPSVLRVIRRSGHRTLRVSFKDSVPSEERLSRLHSLQQFGASFEGANEKYFALDIEPTGDYSAVRARLEEWVTGDVLAYETCEARVPGSFDDEPSQDDDEAG